MSDMLASLRDARHWGMLLRNPHYDFSMEEREKLAREVLALSAELRAFSLVAYGNALPDGVTTEAFAEAELLRREAAELRGVSPS